MSGTSLNIPLAESVDYANADEICGYQLLLCKMFEQAGGLNIPTASNKETSAIRREGLTWLRNVKGIIENLFLSPITPDSSCVKIILGDIPDILGSYEFFYYVCHGRLCSDFIKDIRFKTANRWLDGDKSITEAQVALMLRKEINRDIRKIEQRYLDFSGSVMTSWITYLRIYGNLKDMTCLDAYRVLDFLLRDDLFAFGVNKEDKLKWLKAYTLSESEIDRLNLDNLWAYMRFNQASAFLVGKKISEQGEQYTRFLSKILAHPDTNRFVREAIELELATYEIA